jgi:hypothetical protein
MTRVPHICKMWSEAHCRQEFAQDPCQHGDGDRITYHGTPLTSGHHPWPAEGNHAAAVGWLDMQPKQALLFSDRLPATALDDPVATIAGSGLGQAGGDTMHHVHAGTVAVNYRQTGGRVYTITTQLPDGCLDIPAGHALRGRRQGGRTLSDAPLIQEGFELSWRQPAGPEKALAGGHQHVQPKGDNEHPLTVVRQTMVTSIHDLPTHEVPQIPQNTADPPQHRAMLAHQAPHVLQEDQLRPVVAHICQHLVNKLAPWVVQPAVQASTRKWLTRKSCMIYINRWCLRDWPGAHVLVDYMAGMLEVEADGPTHGLADVRAKAMNIWDRHALERQDDALPTAAVSAHTDRWKAG